MNDRIKSLREKSLNAIESLTAERALLVTSFYKSIEAQKLSVPVLRARTFEHILANKELFFDEDLPSRLRRLIRKYACIA